MARRFYSENPISRGTVSLTGDEADHIQSVNRLRVGDNLVLFDGHGKEFLAKIRETGKRFVNVEILETKELSRESQVQLTLAVALPKGDRQKVLVEKLVEVGVSRLIPVHCERSVAIANDKSVQRLRKRVIEACKQCGRNLLMEVSTSESFPDTMKSFGSEVFRFIAQPGYSPANEEVAVCDSDRDKPIVVAIGPEGGFSEREIELATELGWRPVCLAPAIMRVETAAVVAATKFGLR